MAVFFECLENMRFWSKDFSEISNILETSKIIESNLLKVANLKHKKASYCVIDSYFIKLDPNSKPVKFLDLTYKVMQPFTETSGSSIIYGFYLNRNAYLVESLAEFENWMQVLNNKTILTHIEDHFVIIKAIGEGSSASIYLAEELNSNKQYAIKRIESENYLVNQNAFEFFKNEVKALRTLKHPHVVELHYVFIGDESIDLVMEYIPGINLHQKLISTGTIKEKQVCKFMFALLGTLKYIHEKLIGHRDLKLENIMVADDDLMNFKVVDFGLCFQVDREQNKQCGSPGYTAPEVIEGKQYSEKIDIFSIGVIAYTILYGQHPFYDLKQRNVILKNLKCDLHYKNSISKAAQSALSHMLQKDQVLRPTANCLMYHPWFGMKGSAATRSTDFSTGTIK